MKYKFIFILLLSTSSFSIAQDWTFQYTPYYRAINEIHLLSMDDISAIGGWPYNDSITDMLYTDNAGELWQIQDVFPGKMINSGLYYDNGVAICGGLNEVCYRTVDSGRNWVISSFNIELSHRNINKFSKGAWSTAYACGGLDSINGFVMKTEDSGENWTIISEFPEFEIYYIESIDNNNLIICGPENILKKTQNTGELWQECDILDYSENCDLNAIELFGEDYGYCVGGRQGVDSLQLILKTINGGDSWSPCLMSINPCLNDIEIINDSTAYVVGDYGVILKTTNFGENWDEVVVIDNPGIHLYAIDFINSHLGVIAGNYGIVFYYNDGETTMPEVNTNDATNVTSNSARLNGSFNAGFLSTNVSFRYGLDETLENVIPRGTFNGGSLENLSYNLEGLEDNTHYYYCIEIENDYGLVQGDIEVFYTGNPIPNWDFENWTEESYDKPEYWKVRGNVEKIMHEDNFAIKLNPCSNPNSTDDVSGIVNAEIDGVMTAPWHIPAEYITGGWEINSRPDSLYTIMKYEIEPLDSATIFVALISGNEYVSMDWFYINGNEENFSEHGFELTYLNNNIPDRAVVLFLASNAFQEVNVFNSTLSVSDIRFSSQLNIPNSDFSLWTNNAFQFPHNWEFYLSEDYFEDTSYISTVCRVEDAYYNDYAISVKNVITDTEEMLGRISYSENKIAINKRFKSFSGYYKYFPENNDTAKIYIELYKFGQGIALGLFEQSETVNEWTSFTIDLHYYDEDIVPDSMSISLQASQWEMTGESELHLDKLSMDGDFIPVEVQSVEEIKVYPNPFRDYLTIISDDFTQDEYSVEVYNSAMILVRKFNVGKIISNEIKLDLSNLDQGVYFIKVLSKDKEIMKLFKTIKI